MQYTGFEISAIIDACKTTADVQRVGNIVWEDSPSFLPRYEMAWFAYCLTKKANDLRLRGYE